MDFNNTYNRDDWKQFFQNKFLPEDYQPQLEPVELLINTKYIKQLTILGEHRPWGLMVYEIQHESDNDPRVSLTKETFRIMKEYHHTHVLALYSSSHTSKLPFIVCNTGL
ncbi:MAG: hypothetical protein MUF15_12205 [Acidobacteria bacterium]|jgi:hypothetical protein|nr:hypothetical protein [Acidobacteriota bacterium]